MRRTCCAGCTDAPRYGEWGNAKFAGFSMKRVYDALNLPDAHIVANLLQQAGIDARVFNENAQSVMGEIPITSAMPQVWVMDEAFAARAMQLIESYRKRVPSAATLTCSGCGELSPGEFELCWNCGRALPPIE
jgi:hypothetical protein